MSELRIKNNRERDLHIHITSFSSYNGYKLNSHLTCSRRGFIAQSAEHRTGIAEVIGSKSRWSLRIFCGLFCNCLSYFTTTKISFSVNDMYDTKMATDDLLDAQSSNTERASLGVDFHKLLASVTTEPSSLRLCVSLCL